VTFDSATYGRPRERMFAAQAEDADARSARLSCWDDDAQTCRLALKSIAQASRAALRRAPGRPNGRGDVQPRFGGEALSRNAGEKGMTACAGVSDPSVRLPPHPRVDSA